MKAGPTLSCLHLKIDEDVLMSHDSPSHSVGSVFYQWLSKVSPYGRGRDHSVYALRQWDGVTLYRRPSLTGRIHRMILQRWTSFLSMAGQGLSHWQNWAWFFFYGPANSQPLREVGHLFFGLDSDRNISYISVVKQGLSQWEKALHM